ncbi:MAG: aminoacyl-tRNA deacylase [Chloroflexi bacterium]|nr:aminoacyl-tRNA deacylase [Chloroflexota bacterium]
MARKSKTKSKSKTLAVRLLEGRKIAHETHTYDPERYVSATEVAEAIHMPPSQVFKTLVALPDRGKPILAVLPADRELDLKALAQAAGVKKARMAPLAEAERLTGLKKGGISALALVNRGFRVILDKQAQAFDVIAMSAGVRGVQVTLTPADFVRLTRAKIAAIGR